MANNRELLRLKKIICDQLDPLITEDYYHLDFPNHSNTGDTLIWAGELAYLSRLRYRCLYACDHRLFNKKAIATAHTILLHGGGNFGDMYPDIQQFRLDIIREFKGNRIILFPQTVHYNNTDLLIEEAQVYNSHPDLTICVRDEYSLNLLSAHLSNVNLLLLPDMAFCLDLSDEIIATERSTPHLFLKRTDIELSPVDYTEHLPQDHPVIIKDWPAYDHRVRYYYAKIMTRLSYMIFTLPYGTHLLNPLTGLLPYVMRENQIADGIHFINQYNRIYTTRLHGCILSLLLHKEVVLFDNNYGKNSRFYQAWLSDFEGLRLINV